MATAAVNSHKSLRPLWLRGFWGFLAGSGAGEVAFCGVSVADWGPWASAE
jgi:hypothetical protein